MDLTKSKKRKISDFFAPMPTKVTRYQRHTKTTDIKTTEEPSPIPLRKNVSPVNQGIQTDGVHEINSMKKEGLKFLVSRIASHEAKRATGNFKICSIADDHFFLKTAGKEEWEIHSDPDDGESDDSEYHTESYYDGERYQEDGDRVELGFLEDKSVEFLETIQEKDKTYRERWEETFHNYELKAEELSILPKNSASVDKMTQYGEDNPDEDFIKGVKYMAKEILRNERSRQELEFDESSDEEGCPSYNDCSNSCDGIECRKSYCQKCNGYNGCQCRCSTGECECDNFNRLDPDGSNSDDSNYSDKAWLEPRSKRSEVKEKTDEVKVRCDTCYDELCDCEECGCAEVKRNYEMNRKLFEQSKTPGDLVKDLGKKIIDIRHMRADLDEEPKWHGYY